MSIYCFGQIESANIECENNLFCEFMISQKPCWKLVGDDVFDEQLYGCSSTALKNKNGQFIFNRPFEFQLELISNKDLSTDSELDIEKKMANLSLIHNQHSSKDEFPFVLTPSEHFESPPFVQIILNSLDSWESKMTLGMSRLIIPIAPGYYKLCLDVWGPQVTFPIDKLRKKFLGQSFNMETIKKVSEIKTEDQYHNKSYPLERLGTLNINLNLIYCRRTDYFMNAKIKDIADPIEENIEKVIVAFRTARKKMLDILKEQQSFVE